MGSTEHTHIKRSGGAMGETPVLIGSLVSWQGLFTPAELDAITRHGDSLAVEKAELAAAGTGYDAIRKTLVAWVARNPETEFFYRRLEEAVLAINARYFRFDLSGLATFQYALYGGPEGGHFDWHKDYGRDAAAPQQEPRKLTLSLQLSDPSDYEGCELQVRGGNQIDVAPKARGTLVCFPANVLHQVTPITRGQRRSLVVWAVGPDFR
jgi:PKHD-type hydroxylase